MNQLNRPAIEQRQLQQQRLQLQQQLLLFSSFVCLVEQQVAAGVVVVAVTVAAAAISLVELEQLECLETVQWTSVYQFLEYPLENCKILIRNCNFQKKKTSILTICTEPIDVLGILFIFILRFESSVGIDP